ncbi:pterin dehydratase [Chromatiales bacterium (ex Bugula neritina AB1)]|nr:pterin dehydratase [Chromatiales bacterium (ex Bugula neritina AB1)]
MKNKPPVYSEPQITRHLEEKLPHWWFEDGLIQRRYKVNGWKSSIMIANAIAHLAETAWHHPDLHVSFSSVTVTLSTHTVNGITDLDFELAERIEAFVHWQPDQSSLPGTPDSDRHRYIVYD